MKISISIVYFSIKKLYPQAELSRKTRQDDMMFLGYPKLSSEKVVFKEGNIYVADRTLIPEGSFSDGRCLLVTPNKIPGTMKNISVITVAGVSVADLFNAVLLVFEKLVDWDAALQQLIFENAPLEKYLECSLSVISHPMSVHNENFSYIAKAGRLALSDENIHSRDFFDPDFLLKVDSQIKKSIFFSRDMISYSDELSHLNYLFLNLFSGNTFAGRLTVISERYPFEPYEEELVRHLSRYLQTALSFDSFSGSRRNLRRDSLLDYLSGKTHNDATILHLKTISPFSHLADDQWLYCVVCSDPGTAVSAQYVSYQLERALPESVSVQYDDRIVLVCMNEPGQGTADFYEHIEILLDKLSLTAGISNAFRDFFDLKFCYQEALFALRQIDTLPPGSLMVRFKEVTLEHFLQFGFSIIPIRLICAPCIIRLAEHDLDSSVSYCDSLEKYMDTGCNLAETARLLNISRNTFLSRLERIMRYIDLDLTNGDDRLLIQISLRLIRKTAPCGIAEKQ